MNEIQLLTDALKELRIAALSINSDESYKETTRKYDMLFLGARFNCINSVELHHCLKNTFGIDIPKDQFLKILPSVSEALKMKSERMVFAEDPTTLAAYMIYLFE
ncbi:hypothetical protein [Brevibacillus brevis]|uniref:hypothetical protein n=1 Tax=Brevibacillus brevis TaxID=1393 RepID=UPI00115B5AB0|nr:hypothetical protein [Lysinibacillus sp. SDF0063]TQR33992.1 hypothetical protein C7Y45_18530 [Lysinibacillus sp. SDF0063]